MKHNTHQTQQARQADAPAWHLIPGKKQGKRISSRVLEEDIQRAVAAGHRQIEVEAWGQHGIGGRLWSAGDDPVRLRIQGYSGQRLGSLGFPNTRIETAGPASDDVGWLNAGADIVVQGHAGNGVANAMAQGRVWINGNIGARGMTMTKHNPRFAAPELWVLGSVGDYFGEFMAGGIAVICGVNPQNPHNVLGYRPLVGMVGGKVFVRGPYEGFSTTDARLLRVDGDDAAWLRAQLDVFLQQIGRPELLPELQDLSSWSLLVSRSPHDRQGKISRSMADFNRRVWQRELGAGGLIGDLTTQDRSLIPLITTGTLRRWKPVWENRTYAPPCQAACPTGIPIHERWALIRAGQVDEAVNLALEWTPFPATVCGHLCPNPCMQHCSRQAAGLPAVDVIRLGQASRQAKLPKLPPIIGPTVAVIGGGPAGLSVAWQLRRRGLGVTIYDQAQTLGGKIRDVIPDSRFPVAVFEEELARLQDVLPRIHLDGPLTADDFQEMRQKYGWLVLATGASRPRQLPVPGHERAWSALDFLKQAKANQITPGSRVVIIGAGNVGCDVATEAHRLGARAITLLDVQEPASFGKEREEAEAAGATFRWPCVTQEITDAGVVLDSGELLPADTVVISIGDVPDISYLPPETETKRGYPVVDTHYQTSLPNVFAIGDMVRPGLLTDAIGAGRQVAEHIAAAVYTRGAHTPEMITICAPRPVIDRRRITLEYFDPRDQNLKELGHCGSQCASCGTCRDCSICVTVCPQAAIERQELEGGNYEYRVLAERCIGCGFCAGACPCGVWGVVVNDEG